MEKDLSWKKTTLGGSLKYFFGIWPLLTSGVCQADWPLLSRFTLTSICICVVALSRTWHSETSHCLPNEPLILYKHVTWNLRPQGLNLEHIWVKCQFCQSGYVKRFTSGCPLDVQSVASLYSELKRSVASSSFSVWLCTSPPRFTSQIFDIVFLILHWFLKLVANWNL